MTSGCLRVTTSVSVRSFIARWWLADSTPAPREAESELLGRIVLRPHQVAAIARISAAIAEFGGALLCDEVGTGKTFIALSAARHAGNVLVVAPASLRDMWRDAAARAEMVIAFTSFERLSRTAGDHTGVDETGAGFLIIDEAHHARNPSAARYTALSKRASNTPTLLLSATPVHNRLEDLTTLLALFLGTGARSLSESELSRCVIRRKRAAVDALGGMPRIESPKWCHITHDDAMPGMLLGLPPPIPPRDGGDGGVLLARSLIRQWASSDAALTGGLRRRMQRSAALIAGLENGVYPSATELFAWTGGEDSMQLAFPELIALPSPSASALLEAARAHGQAIREIHDSRALTKSSDPERAAILLRIAQQHEGVKIVAFSQYADTVAGLFRALASRREVAALTARGAKVAGGTLSRAEALHRFAPHAHGVPPPRAADRISLLLTTDLLSEGVNLQDAGVVVHLDIPWTPARLEQRMGRIARLGSMHDRVWSYALKPPASAETLIQIEQTIEKKITIARGALGNVAVGLPHGDVSLHEPFAPNPSTTLAPPELGETIRNTLMTWTGEPSNHVNRDAARLVSDDLTQETDYSAYVFSPRAWVAPVSAVSCTTGGFVAACIVDGQKLLLSSDHGRATEDLRCALDALEHSTGAADVLNETPLRAALVMLHVYFRTHAAMRGISPEAVTVTRSRGTLIRRISRAASNVRAHRRGEIAARSKRAQSIVLARYGIAAEAELCRLSSSEVSDDDFLKSIEAFGALNSRNITSDDAAAAEIVALILLQPGEKPVQRGLMNESGPSKE